MIHDNRKKSVVIALAGSPNVGKSTIFNLLTGLSQHVGNWPGKTVERKTGTFSRGHLIMNFIDLPGTYSLTANSAEEQIARDYIVTENPDLVVAVLNAASLERNLYLVAELIELSPRLVIALNMVDVARQQGMEIDAGTLSASLNIPVVPINARKNQGLDELVSIIARECDRPADPHRLQHVEYGTEMEKVIDHVDGLLAESATSAYPKHWAAMKLLEGDTQINRLIMTRISDKTFTELNAYLKANEAAAVTIATLRYDWVNKMMGAARRKHQLGYVSISERLDRIATHPVIGLLVLLAVLCAIFGLVYSLGIPAQKFLNLQLVQRGMETVNSATGIPFWLRSLLADGLLSGVGTVLTFIPILVFFFAAWALMEDVGYMARAAFVTDRFMHLLGLHGKSVLPLCLGFGCNVPAVLGTRIIDSPRSRLLTIIITPLIPCTGRMAVITFIAAAFFGGQAIFVSVGLILFSLVMLVIVGLIMNRFIISGENTALLMELPLYHTPNPKIIGLVTWQNALAFIKRAGTIILIVSLIVWALSIAPHGNIENSYLSQIGRFLEPAGRLIGLDWQMIVALLSSFIAKENTIASLGTLLAGQGADLTQQLKLLLTPAAALAFLVLQILFIPCIATVTAIHHETKSWRWPALTIAYQLVVSFIMAGIVYRVAQLF